MNAFFECWKLYVSYLFQQHRPITISPTPDIIVSCVLNILYCIVLHILVFSLSIFHKINQIHRTNFHFLNFILPEKYNKLFSIEQANANGNLIPSSLASHVETVMCSTEWQKSISANVIDECQSEIKNYHPWDSANDDDECNPTPFQFTICLLRKFNEQCPIQHRCIQSNGKSTLQTSHDIDESQPQFQSQSQSDEQTKMDFVASRVPSRDHIIFSVD